MCNLIVIGTEPNSAHEVRDVFAHYRSYHPRSHKSPRSESIEWKRIRARLREGYSAEDLKRAIDGCHADPFYALGKNSRGKTYISLAMIMRDSSKVQEFIETWESRGKGPVVSEKTRRQLEPRQTREGKSCAT